MAINPRSVPPSRIHPKPKTLKINYFDRLPDEILLIIFNKIGDVKSLGRCCVVSRRFHSLIPQVENVNVRIDCVFDDESSAAPGIFLGGDTGKPLAATPYSLTQVLNKLNQIRHLGIELPSDESGNDDTDLLKWRAEFGKTVDHCVIFSASSVIKPNPIRISQDNRSIPEPVNKTGIRWIPDIWTDTMITASARHYLTQSVISNHKTLESLIITDTNNRGVFSMNKDHLEEIRVEMKPFSPSLASKMIMRRWFAQTLELPDGTVLKDATLVFLRPQKKGKYMYGTSWMTSAFEEPYEAAAKMLVMYHKVYVRKRKRAEVSL